MGMTTTTELAGLVYASWGRRAVALLIDTALVLGATVGLYLFAWAAGGYDAATDTLADSWLAVYIPLILVGPPVYFWLMIGRYGATLGKRALGIFVRRDDDQGTPVSYARALGRVVSWLVLAFFSLPLLLSVLWPLWDARNQTLVDKMASTVVVRS
jgi:uncharacterized RDD family membrane protein YckC